MEKDIQELLQYASRVESQLKLFQSDMLAESFCENIQAMLGQIRDECLAMASLNLFEKQDAYLRVSHLGSELKTSVHFMH